VKIRIATRKSPLALWQAHRIARLLTALDGGVQTELVSMDTFADLRLDLPIAELGGKGAFSKEVQNVLLAGAADIAVHSAKDLQAVTPAELMIAAVPERGDTRDALVGGRLAELPSGATVATGSNRRRVQLAHLRPDLRFIGLRGNIGTRLGKLEEVDAMVMAKAAVDRLELDLETLDVLDADVMVPQVGQGALAVECRSDRPDLVQLLAAIEHPSTRRELDAERGFLLELGGDCDLPAGANAITRPDGGIELTAVLSSADELRLERVTVDDRSSTVTTDDDAESLGRAAARQLTALLA
jgi:hydroxymethylbilane synthase